MPRAEVVKKQASRSQRAKTLDARKTARRTFTTSDTAGMVKWLKKPGRFDVSGVDTKGKGKGKVRLTVEVRKPTMTPAEAKAYLAEFRKGGNVVRRRRERYYH